MLFNAPSFIFAYLPIVVGVYYLLGHFNLTRMAVAWTALASLVFYSWDDPARLLPIILVSIAFNFIIGRRLARRRTDRRRLLTIGVGGNLIYLIVFKYIDFLAGTLAMVGLPAFQSGVTLPIGISFYTFTQIAYLVDTYRHPRHAYGLGRYTLFVTFFPHLVAGPILHHNTIMPQLKWRETFRFDQERVTLGLAWFAAGMVKKVVLADNLATAANLVFATSDAGHAVGVGQAWLGAISYALQLYFDFSGYSDMAIGLALMMGITFPLNFLSPYKATSLIEFWRRWHISLSRFLRDYLYIPLGGGRQGWWRRHRNLLVTMVLGGLWHGASWNFAVWGALHGAGLVVNHVAAGAAPARKGPLLRLAGLVCTQAFVVLAWVPFRAADMASTLTLWRSMTGGGPNYPVVDPLLPWLLVVGCGAVALALPNTAEIFGRVGHGAAPGRLAWRPDWRWALALGCGFGLSVGLSITHSTAFLYFRF